MIRAAEINCRRVAIFARAFLLVGIAGVSEAAEPSITTLVGEARPVSEKLVSQIRSSAVQESLTASPNGRRIAYVAKAGQKYFVVVDGKEEKQYDGIGKGIFAPVTKAFYWGTPIFSPDSQRLAYVAREGEKSFVVVDGKEQKPYDDINALSLTFSADSQRLAYVVGVGEKRSDDKQTVVIDGKEEKPYDWIGGLLFSPDSRRVAYWAGVGGRSLVVVDGKEGKPYDGAAQGEAPTCFPPDSWWVVSFHSLLFSPDSRRVAYKAVLGLNVFAVVDGKEREVPVPSNIYGGPIFSPDSQRVAYVVDSTQYFVVVDGKEEKHYDEIDEESLNFSPDSRRVAYSAKTSVREYPFVKRFFVVGGKEEKLYDSVAGLQFSPDSRRVAYVAHVGQQQFVVVNGREGKRYDDIEITPHFSPDGRWVAYGARIGAKHFVVMNGKEGKLYDDIVSGIIFESATTLHYLAVRNTTEGNDVYLVEETVE